LFIAVYTENLNKLELLAKLGRTVAPRKVWDQKSPKILDSVVRRNDERALSSKASLLIGMRSEE
jgi:hypothetical protein